MGSMADFAIERGFDEMVEMEEYMSGCMSYEDAYESGIVDHTGTLSRDAQSYMDENLTIQTAEELNRELMYWEGALSGGGSYNVFNTNIKPQVYLEDDFRDEEYPHLNKAAIQNLYKERPTCNICENLMFARQGKYGKFYHCHCDGQPNVSDAYWQKVRRYHEDDKCEYIELTEEQKVIESQAKEIAELKAKLKKHVDWYGDLK